MQNLVRISTPFCEQTVLQQRGGFAELALEGTVEMDDERNYPVVRVVNERTEETELYERLSCENGHWAHTLRLPVGMHRIETGVALAQANFNPYYLGHGDMLRSVFVGEVFAIAGQSNAAGYGKGTVCDAPQYGVSVFDGDWRTAAHPIGQTKTSAAFADALNCGHSAWLSLGKRILEQTGTPVGLVPAALNGSGIRNWQPGEPLFENLVALCLETGAGNIIWYQGCTDTDEPDDYAELLERMLRKLQGRLGSISVLIVQLSGTTNEQREGRGWRLVREAQRASAVRFGAMLIPTYDLTRYCDDIHLGPEDNLLLGERAVMQFLRQTPAGEITARQTNGTVEVRFNGVRLRPGKTEGVLLLDAQGEAIPCEANAEGSILQLCGKGMERARRVTLAFDRIYTGASPRDEAGEILPYFDIPIE
ncbi:MAG TPA: sialate O-acetylesterase [Feifaniaceae bacterium]|nr:sialate O-acetylesterase [Feifaniaceae bacterium]